LVGSNFPIVIANLPPTAPPVLMLGLSNTTWRGVSLPLSLAPLGAPGCDLLTSSDVFLPIGNFNGTAYTSLAIPPDAVPSATPVLFAQGLALDPGANQLGTVVSNGAALAIGIR
jgi:hypothetical protein